MGRYLVTGCAGFIGSRIAGLLLEAGHEVVGADDLNPSTDPRLKQHRLESLRGHAGFAFAQLDLSRRDAFAHAIFAGARFDGLLHLAARAGVRASVDDPWIYVDSNVTATVNALEFCRHHGVAKFVLASTSSLYGAINPVPYAEDCDTSRPLSPYAASKGGAEGLCHTYHALHGLDVSVLRFFTVYGPAGRPDMAVFRFVQCIREGRPIVVYGDGSMSRDFTYVDDVARGAIASLAPLGFEVINLGGDRPHSVAQLVALVEQRVGRAAQIERRPPHAADVPETWADVRKARRLLGWTPEVALEEGIRRTVEWYEREREWASQVKSY